MEKPHLEGIVLKSDEQISEEKRKAEKELLARNMLQFAYAKHLKFDEHDEGSTFDEFVFKYAKPIGDLLEDHPEYITLYSQALTEGKEKDFDFTNFSKNLQPYLPIVH